MRLLPAAAIALTLSACAGPRTYRLTDVLTPPGVKSSETTERTIKLRARPCSLPADGPHAERRGRKLLIEADRNEMGEMGAGALARWGVRLEEEGCLPAGSGLPAARAVARALPLAPGVARRLLHASERHEGYLDLRPGYRIRVTRPLLREGAAPDAAALSDRLDVEAAEGLNLTITVETSEDLIGFERAWYAVLPRAAGAEIQALTATQHIDGETMEFERPSRADFPFDPSAGYFRLLFLSRMEESPSNDILALGAPTPAALEARYERVRDDPERCASEPGFCIRAPRDVAFLPFLTVTVNGAETRLAPGARVRDALREAGEEPPGNLVPALTVRKPFGDGLARVEFDSDAILDLPLEGGEQLAWRAR